MRFLIGIFTGAVVTLLVATAMDAPTHPLLSNARDLASSGWDRLISATSSSLFEPAQEAPTAEPEPTTEREPEAVDQQAPMPQPVEEQAQLEEQIRLAEQARLAEQDRLDEQAAYIALEQAALEPAPALPAPDPIAESPSSAYWVETALAAAERAHANQPVWVPFHSQMSAEGFATRLSRALNHEFRVVRQGAGAYQVVFDAADADEQALIMAQVTEITGQ